jgi:(p)ppGpp synthase/HD superfamily hydrolase
MANIERAINVALVAHHGQRDKAGLPYILHPLYVMGQMKSENQMIVAVLHDIIEDTELTLSDLRSEGFSERIVRAVDAMTKRDGEFYRDYLKRVKRDPLALSVKLEDIRHNSSPERLENLPQDTAEYLATKYKKALDFLAE